MHSAMELLKQLFSGKSVNEAKSFRENQACEGAFDHVDRGICNVPLDRIVGSVGRYHDFDRQFKLKGHVPPDRLIRVKEAMRQGRSLPPVKLYKIKDEYYVLDGNHRISAAKEFGCEDILAKIVEFIPSSNTLENIIYREKSEFLEKTGLKTAIELTEVGQYHRLMEQIDIHKTYLETTEQKAVLVPEAAADWYRTIYLPLVEIVRKTGLSSFFKGRTVGDLYAYISFYQWEKGRIRKYGIGIDKLIPNSMETFREKMAKMKKEGYPEMLRGITTFIMITTDAKRENRVFERIFALPEVTEIHSVHGSIDILVKAELTRNFLTSDAEVIGEFVQTKIRQIPGVVTTQTLIPGQSRNKTADTAKT